MEEVKESGSGNCGAAQPSNINESLGSCKQKVSSKNESSVRVDDYQSDLEQFLKRLNEIEERIESNRILEKIHRKTILGPAIVAAQLAHDHRVKFENFMRASGIPFAEHPTNPRSSQAEDQRRRLQIELDLHREQQRSRRQEEESREQQLGDKIILQEIKEQKKQVKRELPFDELEGHEGVKLENQQLGDQKMLQEVKKQKIQVKREHPFDELEGHEGVKLEKQQLGDQKMLQEVKKQKIQVKRELPFDELEGHEGVKLEDQQLGDQKMLQEVKKQKIQVKRKLRFDELEGHKGVKLEKQQLGDQKMLQEVKEQKIHEDVTEEEQQQPFTEQLDGIYAYRHAPPHQILITKFGYTICGRDIRTLGPECCLNDDIINFYLNLVMERSKQRAKDLPSVYVFNTFFLNRLRLSDYEGVKHRTRKVDIFGKKIVIVPYLHNNKFWVMIVINMRRKEIIYFDSLKKSDPIPLLKLLQSYLLDESWDKRQQQLDKRAFTCSVAKNLPLLTNEYDSGVFVCQFAEVLTRSEPIKFTQAFVDVFRQTMIQEIVNGKLC